MTVTIPIGKLDWMELRERERFISNTLREAGMVNVSGGTQRYLNGEPCLVFYGDLNPCFDLSDMD